MADPPDLSVEWSDVKVTFRILKEATIDSELQYPLYPLPEDLSQVPSILSLKRRKIRNRRQKFNTIFNETGLRSRSSSLDGTGSTALTAVQRAAQVSVSNSVDPNKSLIERPFFSEWRSFTAKSHSTEKPFQCEICNWGFFEKHNLKEHMASHNQSGRRVRCQHCTASFANEEMLHTHVIEHHNEQHVNVSTAPVSPSLPRKSKAVMEAAASKTIWKCPICNKQFVTESTLRQHVQLHQVQRSDPCDFCGARFATNGSLRRHEKNVHAQNYRCSQCSITFRTTTDMKRHMEDMHSSANGFQNLAEDLLEPEDLRDGDEESEGAAGNQDMGSLKQFSCSICFQSFDKVQLLNKHVRSHKRQNFTFTS